MTSTVVVSIGAVTLALLVLGAGAAALFTYLRREFKSERASQVDHKHYESRIVALELQVQGLPSLWEDERRRAKQNNDSAKAARRAAEAKLDEVEDLLESREQLSFVDAEGGGAGEVQHVPSGLAPPADPSLAEKVAAVAHLMR